MMKILNFVGGGIGQILYKMMYLKKICIGKYLSKIIHNYGGRISGEVQIQNPENVYLGKNSYVNGGQLIAGKNAKIKIGENCMISYNVHIRCDQHLYKNRNIPMILQGHEEHDIVIQDNCWICHSVHIMPGCVIGSGSIVAANSVVTKSVPPNTLVGGVPARIIKELKTNLNVKK